MISFVGFHLIFICLTKQSPSSAIVAYAHFYIRKIVRIISIVIAQQTNTCNLLIGMHVNHNRCTLTISPIVAKLWAVSKIVIEELSSFYGSTIVIRCFP